MISIPTYLMSEIRKIDLMGLIRRRYLLMGLVILSIHLVAACWFNYLFFFLKRVVKTPAAPSALLAGQIADGIATPLVGYFSDRTKTKFGNISNNIGQRSPWYVLGLVLVVSCYIPIYQTFISDNKSNEYAYYIIFPAIFNIG